MEALVLAALLFPAVIGDVNGRVMKRIKGPGTLDAEPGEFSFLVNIVDVFREELICSGVLIKSKVVLTSAESLAGKRPYELLVILGEHDRSNPNEETKQRIGVSKIVPHPAIRNPIEGDLALLQLESEPRLGKRKRVQKLGIENIAASKEEDRTIHRKSFDCVVPGFGYTEWDKFETKLPTTLKKFIPNMIKPWFCTGAYFKKQFLCASNIDHTNACKFDGGAPLLCMKDGQLKLYGFTMGYFGHTIYCDEGLSLFTRVSTYYDWIKRKSKKLQREKSQD